MRKATLIGDTFVPLTERYVRRLGRPCKEWTKTVMADAIRLFGSSVEVWRLAQSKPGWNKALYLHFEF